MGKTATVIAASLARQLFPILVVCPASLKLNWQNEFKLWGNFVMNYTHETYCLKLNCDIIRVSDEPMEMFHDVLYNEHEEQCTFIYDLEECLQLRDEAVEEKRKSAVRYFDKMILDMKQNNKSYSISSEWDDPIRCKYIAFNERDVTMDFLKNFIKLYIASENCYKLERLDMDFIKKELKRLDPFDMIEKLEFLGFEKIKTIEGCLLDSILFYRKVNNKPMLLTLREKYVNHYCFTYEILEGIHL